MSSRKRATRAKRVRWIAVQSRPHIGASSSSAAAAAGGSAGGPGRARFGVLQPPPLDAVMTLTKTFRWLVNQGVGALSTSLSATDIDRLLGVPVDGTHIIPIIGTWKINWVRLYSAPTTAIPGLTLAATASWSDGSAAMDSEQKASVKQAVSVGTASANFLSLVPPAKSTYGFWHGPLASGNVMDLNQPSGQACVFDLNITFTLANREPILPSVVVTAANLTGGINQREIFNGAATPVGVLGYVP